MSLVDGAEVHSRVRKDGPLRGNNEDTEKSISTVDIGQSWYALGVAGANEYDWHAGVSLHSYCAIFDALLVISRAKSLRAITVPYGIYSTYVPLAAGSTTVHPTYACTSAAEPHFPGSEKIEVLSTKPRSGQRVYVRSEAPLKPQIHPGLVELASLKIKSYSSPWEFGPWHSLIEMPVEGAWQNSKVSRSAVPQWLRGLSPFPPLASNPPQHPPQSNQTVPNYSNTFSK
ncbi:unnamed protein product [Leuciscus chuanchicus]